MSGASTRRRILLVDDEVSLTRLLKLNLEQAGGFDVRTESNGRQALATAEAFQPDLIVLDIIMPDLGGLEIAQQFKAHPKLARVPVIFLTAGASREETSARQDLSSYPFLAKPINLQLLLEQIHAHLGLLPKPSPPPR